jgi:hypothetical protein
MRAMALIGLLSLRAVAGADMEIPVQYADQVKRVNELGATIWRLDSAAARATDELVSRDLLNENSRVRGWLTDEYPAGKDLGVIVTFVGDVDGAMLALYRVRVPPDGDTSFEALAKPETLDQPQQARLRARTSALEALGSEKLRCGESYNTVVMPAADGVGIRVYLLAATSQSGVLIAGGHHLYEYQADGTTLRSHRAFTRSCIDIPLSDSSKGEVKALTLTHLLDPTPTEVHSYLSRYARKPVYLGTAANSLLWIILTATWSPRHRSKTPTRKRSTDLMKLRGQLCCLALAAAVCLPVAAKDLKWTMSTFKRIVAGLNKSAGDNSTSYRVIDLHTMGIDFLFTDADPARDAEKLEGLKRKVPSIYCDELKQGEIETILVRVVNGKDAAPAMETELKLADCTKPAQEAG